MDNKFHISLSPWRWTSERNRFVDIISINLYDRSVLAITPKPLKMDYQLFLRPFTNNAWIAILLILTAICMAMLMSFSLIADYLEDTFGYNAMVFMSWWFFLLVNAFFGGAMTMFFTTETTIPFDNLIEVMRVNNVFRAFTILPFFSGPFPRHSGYVVNLYVCRNNFCNCRDNF